MSFGCRGEQLACGARKTNTSDDYISTIIRHAEGRPTACLCFDLDISWVNLCDVASLNQLQPPQARVPLLADDEVIVHGDAERLCHLDDDARHFDVGARGSGRHWGDCAPGHSTI